MKTYRKQTLTLAFSIAFLLIANICTFAQGQRLSPEEHAVRQTERMVEKLDLSDDQKVKVEEINLRYANKMKAEMERNQGNREAMRTIMQAMRKDQLAEMKSVLTDKQFKKFKKMAAKGRGQGGGKRGGGRRGGM